MRLIVSLTLVAMMSVIRAQAPAPQSDPVPAGTYRLDKSHASLIFRVSHLGFSTYTGRFTRYDAQLQFDPARPASSHVSVTIDPRSITADNAPDGFIESLANGADWLNAAQFPEMKFVSRSVVVSGRDLRIAGELTLRGVTKPIVLEARYNGGYASHPYDPAARIGFSAHGSIKRSDFGIEYGLPDPGSSFGVGDEVQVILEAEFSGPPLKTARR